MFIKEIDRKSFSLSPENKLCFLAICVLCTTIFKLPHQFIDLQSELKTMCVFLKSLW